MSFDRPEKPLALTDKYSDLLRKLRPVAFVSLLFAGSTLVAAQGHAKTDTSIFDLPIDQLLQIKVTSAARKSQAISDTPAAIYVITQEMIARSAANNIPDLLRMVPGIEVARIDANKWSITSRGFSGRFANKLLVLVDGRTVYTPFFSGVFWDQQDLIMADIERIEVIRGPGGAVWGANAVNGIINVITKSAKKTQGGYAKGLVGTQGTGSGAIRFGDKIGKATYFRAHAKYFGRDSGDLSTGGEGADDWKLANVGFRMDSKVNAQDSLSVRGQFVSSETGETFPVPSISAPFSSINEGDSENKAGFFALEWNRTASSGSKYKVQTYYDHVSRNDPRARVTADTFDLDFQHQFKLGNRHDIVWGAGYRLISDDSSGSFSVSLAPESDTYDRLSFFLQDEISVIQNTLAVSIGAKVEHNDFTGFEFQPSVRGTWKIDPNQTAWGAVSKAVRTPDRGTLGSTVRQMVIPGAPPLVVTTIGNPNYDSEEVIAYELGYRSQISDKVSADIAAFYNVYDKLTGGIAGTPFFDPSLGGANLVTPVSPVNIVDGQSYGIELSANWRANDWVRFQGSYSYLQLELDADPIAAPGSETAEDESPHHQFKLRSAFTLGSDTSLDVYLRYVGEISGLGIDDYMTLDFRFGWKAMPGVEFAIIGRNLLDGGQAEYS
jgi:iron complex outermembrane receptor protein